MTEIPELPQQAITDAYAAVADVLAAAHYGQAAGREVIARALKAAEPHIRADERERCAQRAEQVRAKYVIHESGLPIASFADLLREQS
jgi:hypothetical protein